jgi:hypothetical protein
MPHSIDATVKPAANFGKEGTPQASEDVIRGNVDSLMKLIGALETSGVELINDGSVSQSGGRGVRLKASAKNKNSPPDPRAA